MAGKILLVEPSVSDQRLVETALAAEFLEVVSVVDSIAALDHVREELPALVLAAMELADGPVEALLEQLRADPRSAHVPVVLLGADAGALADAVQTGGVAAILGKPLEARELIETVYRTMSADDGGGGERTDWIEAAGDGHGASEPSHGADPFGSDGDFDLAGALDTVDTGIFARPAGLGGLGPSTPKGTETRLDVKPAALEGLEQTVVMRRDDLGALRSGMGVTPPRRPDPPRSAAKPASAGKAPATPEPDSLEAGEATDLNGFQTMIMSRDELSALRSKAAPAKPGGGAGGSGRPALATPRAGTPRLSAPAARSGPSAPAEPGSPQSVEAMIRDAARATESELVAVLAKLDPKRIDAVKRIAGELVERVARRVATEVAERLVQEEIGRIKRAAEAR